MAESRGRPGSASQRPTGGDKAVLTQKKQYFRRKKVCRFCVEKIDDINYKDVQLLHAFVAERGKIIQIGRLHDALPISTQKKQYFRRKKVCRFCVEKIDDSNYKDVKLLHAFVAERGKIIPRRISGVCAPHQRRLTDAIKKARNIALLPFAASFR